MTGKKRKLRKKMKDITLSLIIVILLGVAGFCGFKIWEEFHTMALTEQEVNELNLLVKNNIGDAKVNAKFSKKAYEILKSENKDFKAYLAFDNGLISIPIVQSTDNDYYLRRSYYGEYADLGTPFFHYASKETSQNIMVYGHNASANETLMFSPLRTLLKSDDVFVKNNTFDLYFEDEVRHYEIVAMYWYDLTQDGEYDFTVTDWYDLDSYNHYFNFVDSKNLIIPRRNHSFTDNFVTFQTCRSKQPNFRLIVISVETGRESY